MKKILSIALCVLLVVCGVLPAFVTNTAAADSNMLGALGHSLPTEYVGGGSAHFRDFVQDNTNLKLDSDYTISNEYGDYVGVFKDAKFAVKFYVDVPGVYEFCIKNYVRGDDTWGNIQDDGMTLFPHPGTVQIDDGDVYTVSANAVLVKGESNFSGPYYFGGIRVELSAGYHTMYLSSDQTHPGLIPYFLDAYWYCAERTGTSADMPFEDYIALSEVDTTAATLPGTVEVTVPYDGKYSVAALVENTSGTAGVFTVVIGDDRYTVYELDNAAAGDVLYYEVAEGVALEAGTHTVKIDSYGSQAMPKVNNVVFAMTELVGIYETNPYTKATAVNFNEQWESNVQTDDNGFNFYCYAPRDYAASTITGAGGVWIVDPSYTYTVKFTPENSGVYTFAMYLAHRADTKSAETTSMNVVVSAGDEIIGEYGFNEFTGKANSQRYYDLAQGVKLDKDVEYTVAVTVASLTDSTINDFLYQAEKLNGISEGKNNPNVGFENADVIAIAEFTGEDHLVNPQKDENGGYNYYHWAGGDYQSTLPGKTGVMLTKDNNPLYIPLTVAEDGEYSLSLFLANGYLSKDVSSFTITVKDGDDQIGTYTVTEIAPFDLGSKVYYHFADDLALKAGVEYTVDIRKNGATNSTLVELQVELTSVVKEAIAKEDKPIGGEVAVGDLIPAAPIVSIPGANGGGKAENQPIMNVINPVPDTDASDNVPAEDESVPPQPNFNVSIPAAPGAFGKHYMIPALPAMMP